MKLKLIFTIAVLVCTPLFHSAQNLEEDFNKWTQKGRDFVGLSFSVAHEEGTNVQGLLLTDDELYNLKWAVRFYGGHFIKKNITVGALFEWNQSNGDRIYELDGNTIREDHFSRGFLLGPTFRTYIPLSKSNRAALFNEANLLFGYERSIEQSDNNTELNRAISNSYSLSLGLTPGINFYIADGWAFEVAIELLGLQTQVTRGKRNDVETEYFSNDVSFSINLLALKLGVTKYF
jgi:hypothetical protein